MKLYECPVCGYIDHDEQDGTGHWEHGGSNLFEMDNPNNRWSQWLLQCNGCGEINEMMEAEEDILKGCGTS